MTPTWTVLLVKPWGFACCLRPTEELTLLLQAQSIVMSLEDVVMVPRKLDQLVRLKGFARIVTEIVFLLTTEIDRPVFKLEHVAILIITMMGEVA